MRIEYDNEVDALYILLRDVKPVDTMDIEEGVTVDLDENRHIVGIEILDATEKLGLESLVNVSIENMPRRYPQKVCKQSGGVPSV